VKRAALFLWEENMDNEEYVHAQIVMGNTPLVVQALQEANDELQSEVAFLKEENARLRNHNRVVTAMRRQLSGKALDLMKQVEDMGQHIMEIAANEAAEDSDTTPASV
jgi:predicted nuclease with TOPRIM domain